VVLEQVFGVAEVPPDVRVIHAVARQQELQSGDEQGQNDEEGTNNAQTVAKPRRCPNRRLFSR